MRRSSTLCAGLASGLLCLLVFASACQSEVDPASVTARVVSAGEYEIRDGLPVLRQEKAAIACEFGRIFGVDYRIDVANGEHGVIPVTFRWTHPELAVPSRKLWGRESEARKPNPVLLRGENTLSGRALWSFEHPDELVSGRYEFEIRHRESGQVILVHAFDVVGC